MQSFRFAEYWWWFPNQKNLNFKYDYAYMVREIVSQIKLECSVKNINDPHIFTEFGSYTVGESGGTIYKIIHQKTKRS